MTDNENLYELSALVQRQAELLEQIADRASERHDSAPNPPAEGDHRYELVNRLHNEADLYGYVRSLASLLASSTHNKEIKSIATELKDGADEGFKKTIGEAKALIDQITSE